MTKRLLESSFLGRVPYRSGVLLQDALRAEVLAGTRPDTLVLLEHPPVFTLGRNADVADVTAPDKWLHEHGVEVHETNRGGQVTYHGPGQLVGYPIFNLHPDRRDVRRYVRNLQESLVVALRAWNVEARGGDGRSIGVWTGEPGRKIASIGIHLKRWVTTHGFALNVQDRVEEFSGIVACGLPGVVMTSIQGERGLSIELEEAARHVTAAIGEVFELHVRQRPAGVYRELVGSESEAAAGTKKRTGEVVLRP